MLLTTSRKPGRKTRTLAKVLARYFNWRYVNRGKMSLEDIFSISDDVAIISEIKGNPSLLKIYTGGKEKLRLRFNLGKINKIKMDDSTPVFVGDPPFDPLIFGALPKGRAGMKLTRKVEFSKEILVKKSRLLLFYYNGEEVLILKLLKVENVNQKA
jgi:U3 small nucleolar ribonucleoprotein protein IMP4